MSSPSSQALSLRSGQKFDDPDENKSDVEPSFDQIQVIEPLTGNKASAVEAEDDPNEDGNNTISLIKGIIEDGDPGTDRAFLPSAIEAPKDSPILKKDEIQDQIEPCEAPLDEELHAFEDGNEDDIWKSCRIGEDEGAVDEPMGNVKLAHNTSAPTSIKLNGLENYNSQSRVQ